MQEIISFTLWVMSSLWTTCASQALPYDPTTILIPQSSPLNESIAYVFLRDSETDDQRLQLAALNISSSVAAANLSFETVTSTLPFPNGGSNTFTPFVSGAGEISVYAGSCSSSDSSELWRFKASSSSSIDGGNWTKQQISFEGDISSASTSGAQFLAHGFAFSSLVKANASQTNLYTFGGMCPGVASNVTNWQASASYSNHILRFGPFANNEYSLSLPTSRGPPIPEAGFTITGLIPTYSNASGIMTQQQNFVLIGGHTQSAFINMSQVAIWSLPEESWSFVTVDPPAASGTNTELAVKSTVTSVDSRSGHTAVLSTDGSSLVVYGGWVGDTGQAAEPQLAMLNIGTGFGGSGDWQWTVPTAQPSGNGIFGHGAVMLPGNVMMVLGGYSISESPNAKRQDRVPATSAMFFNITSTTWSSEYTNPDQTALNSETNRGPSKSHSRNVGLGVGLGLVVAAIIGAGAIFCWYSRRLQARREVREKNIGDLAMMSANHHASSEEMGHRSGVFPWANGRWNGSSGDYCSPSFDSNSAVAGFENLQSGVHGLTGTGTYPPLPLKQIARKPLHSRNARGLYQAAPSYDFNTSSSHGRTNSLGTAGPIHPIYEADEDDQIPRNPNVAVGIALGDPAEIQTDRHLDPFKDPSMHHSSIVRRENQSMGTPDAESPARSREREIQEWVSDWAAADALLNAQARSHSTAGRLSPTRRAQLIAASTVSSLSAEEDSGRTASNLSDRSVAVSAMSISRSGSSSQGRSRSNSLRGLLTTAMSPFTAAVNPHGSNLGSSIDGHRIPPAPRSAGSTSSSFTTANTSFAALQVEGETLLPRPDEISGAESSPIESQLEPPGSPSKTRGVGFGKGRGQVGWLGSLKRVFVGDPVGTIDPGFQAVPSRDPSPLRDSHCVGGSLEPRRTVSAGATMWRRKQGKTDWNDSAQISEMSVRSHTFTSDTAATFGPARGGSKLAVDEEEEWDIEQAVQNRVVQVMFTVPKEKLRVVNRHVDDDLSEVESLRSKKGSGKSVKTIGEGLESVAEVHKFRGKGKAKESEDSDVENSPTRGRGKSKVLKMVEAMEERNSPER